MAAFFGLAALAFRILFLVLSGDPRYEFRSPSFWLHVAGIVPFLAAWWLCGRGCRSRTFVHALEFGTLLVGCGCYQLMGVFVPLAAQPMVIVAFIMTHIVVARAVYVPSSARRTAILTTALGVPLIAATYWTWAFADPAEREAVRLSWGLPEWPLWQMVAAQVPMVTMWWTLTTILATATSTVIYGLRREVREARRLGQYTLQERLGAGGMGEVYKACHGMLRRPTAIKLLLPGKAGEGSLARFEREVQLTARLTHPNTVTIFDYGRTPGGVFYYAMELLDGASLDIVVEVAGPMPPERVLHVLHGVAGSLAEAHGVGLIHRDIKPANIILTEQGGVPDVAKVVDFGLVKELRNDLPVALTAAESVTGTPLYMSPEALTSPRDVDARTDLYAVGAVGYFLLTGEHVFSGRNAVEIFGHHLHSEPEPPAQRLGSPVPPDLEAVILECLRKDRGLRPQTAQALQERLAACRDFSGWDAGRARSWWQRYGPELRNRRQTAAGEKLEAPQLASASVSRAFVEPEPQAGRR
jgi:serine/threonine-protein kinase